MRSYGCAAVMLALATCLKVNIVLLIPGLLLFLWAQPHRLRTWSMVLAIYVSTIVVLYTPFWQNGAILNILRINPGTYRDINTIPEFLTHLYNSLVQGLGFPRAADIGSPTEYVTHALSIAMFVVAYSVIFWKTLSVKHGLRTPTQLLRWMALVWFLYCIIGSPWSWPWYTITFFGLFALVESVDGDDWHNKPFFGFLYLPLAVRLLAFSMLSLYCFYAWAPSTTYIPWLPDFRWAWLRGLWAWAIPLLAVFLRSHSHIAYFSDPLRKDLIEEKQIPSF